MLLMWFAKELTGATAPPMGQWKVFSQEVRLGCLCHCKTDWRSSIAVPSHIPTPRLPFGIITAVLQLVLQVGYPDWDFGEA